MKLFDPFFSERLYPRFQLVQSINSHYRSPKCKSSNVNQDGTNSNFLKRRNIFLQEYVCGKWKSNAYSHIPSKLLNHFLFDWLSLCCWIVVFINEFYVLELDNFLLPKYKFNRFHRPVKNWIWHSLVYSIFIIINQK